MEWVHWNIWLALIFYIFHLYKKIHNTKMEKCAGTWFFVLYFSTRHHISRYLFIPLGKRALTFRTTDNRKKRKNIFENAMLTLIVRLLWMFSVPVACLLGIFWHNCNTFGVDNPQEGIFKKASQRGLTCLPQSTNSCPLEHRFVLKSHTRRWKGSLWMRNSVDFW